MFTYLIYRNLLREPDSFWAVHHIASLWCIGFFFDLLLIFILWLGYNAVLAGGASDKAMAARAQLARIASALKRIDRVIMVAAGIVLACLVLVTFISVTARTVYKPIPDDITFAEWSLVAMVAMMLGTLQGREDHIEITALSDTLSYRVNLWLRLIGVLIGLVAVTRLGFVSLEKVPDSFLEITYGSIYELPAWPPRVIFIMGLAWWITRILTQALILPSAIRSERRGDLNWLNMWPMISHTGTGDLDTLDDSLFEDAEASTGGPRGS